MAFILATDFDLIAYMSKMAFFLAAFFTPMAFLEYDFNDFCCSVRYASKQNRCRISHTQRKKSAPSEDWTNDLQIALRLWDWRATYRAIEACRL